MALRSRQQLVNRHTCPEKPANLAVFLASHIWACGNNIFKAAGTRVL